MSSNEDRPAVRDPEVKETEDVEVDGGAVEGSENDFLCEDLYVL